MILWINVAFQDHRARKSPDKITPALSAYFQPDKNKATFLSGL